MTELIYTLIGDGTSEAALIPLLDWLIRESGYQGELQGQCCDFRLFKRSSNNPLEQRITYGLRFYPCDLLFVHRDAERASPPTRVREIQKALCDVSDCSASVPAVCVVPVRMTEAWLLFNESAIRHAAGNPNGQTPLLLPTLDRLESLPNPKDILFKLIRQATELPVHRRESFRVSYSALQITKYIQDFSPLRLLSAFSTLEYAIRNIIDTQGWDDR